MPLTGALVADFSSFVGETQKANTAMASMEDQAKKTGVTLDKQLKTADTAGSQLTGTLKSLAGAFGIAFSVEAVIGFGQEILRTADEITRLADQTGLTVEQVQRLSYTAGQAGNTLDQITTAASKMQASLDTEKGQKAVEALGISFRQFAAAQPYDQLLQVSDALRAIPDPTERAQRAVELFGESGAKILPTLVSDMRAVGEAAQVSSDEQIAALDAAGDAIDRWAKKAKTGAVSAAGGILLAGEQIADQGLLKTIQLWVDSPTSAQFLQTLTDIRTRAQQAAAAIKDVNLPVEGGAGKETPAARAARERDEAAAKREHEQATKALAAAQAELAEVRKGYGGLMASMTEATVKAVQADLELGASQATIATAYGLTAQQVKAAAEELKSHVTIVDGLGPAWANVGEQVTVSIDGILAELQRLTDETKAYEAETRRQVDAWNAVTPPVDAATRAVDGGTAAVGRMTVQMSALQSQARSTFDQLQAGMALMEAYQKAGVATGMQIATGGYTFGQLQQGMKPTWSSQGPTATTLNVNVNNADALGIANKLVTEMRHQGVRF